MKALVIGEPQGLAQSLKQDFASKGLEVMYVSTQDEAQQALSKEDATLVIGDFIDDAISILQWVRRHPAKPIKEGHFFFAVNAMKPAMDEIQEKHGAAFFTPGQWYARGIANFGNLEATV